MAADPKDLADERLWQAGRRIRTLRNERGLSTRDLATEFSAFVGFTVDRAAPTAWEHGQRITVPTSRALAKFFGVSLTYLLGDTEDRDKWEPDDPKYFTKPSYRSGKQKRRSSLEAPRQVPTLAVAR